MSRGLVRRARLSLGVVAAGITGALLAVGPAAACGGLVGENGTISLVRTTTLAAYHDGVERYVTSFEFSGEGKEVGSIVPLPDVPIEGRARRRLDAATTRARSRAAAPAGAQRRGLRAQAPASAQVILETKIDALDITILKGGGDEVGAWALQHGFFLSPDAPEVLDFYSRRSPIFMAARFDAARASELGQQAGDGTPIMLTIPTDEPWVPLRILGLGSRPEPGRGSGRLPAHRRPAEDARRRPRPQHRARRARVGFAAHGPAFGCRHGVGAELDVVHVPAAQRRGTATSTTTSRSRPTRRSCRR